MKRMVPLLLAMLCAFPSDAEEQKPSVPSEPRERGYTGIFSHGDSSGFMEDYYGGRVDPQPVEGRGGTNKHDPAIRWDRSIPGSR